MGFETEAELYKSGFISVAGIDEAGRGPLAGPVAAAAVILNPLDIPEGINDSKKLSEKKREALFEEIKSRAKVSCALVWQDEIDEINILNATKKAMALAVRGL